MVDIDGVIPTELELLRLKVAILELEAVAKVQQGRLRDQFAMAALTGLVSRNRYNSPPDFARDAYAIADAILAERDK